jgi:putative FmdB family regulatory protein
VLIPAPIAEDPLPTYQYVCTECGSDLEAVQSFSDPSLTDCPTCAGKLRKRFGAVGVVFKGSGFYRTDSRTDARRSNESKSDGDKTSSDSGTKTETKAESGSASKDAKTDSGTKSKPEAGSASGTAKASSAA